MIKIIIAIIICHFLYKVTPLIRPVKMAGEAAEWIQTSSQAITHYWHNIRKIAVFGRKGAWTNATMITKDLKAFRNRNSQSYFTSLAFLFHSSLFPVRFWEIGYLYIWPYPVETAKFSWPNCGRTRIEGVPLYFNCKLLACTPIKT